MNWPGKFWWTKSSCIAHGGQGVIRFDGFTSIRSAIAIVVSSRLRVGLWEIVIWFAMHPGK